MADTSGDLNTFDLSNLSLKQREGTWFIVPLVWSGVALLGAAVAVFAYRAVSNPYGISGTAIYLAGLCVVLPILWWTLYAALYSSSPGPTKVEVGPTHLSFTLPSGRFKRISLSDPHLRIVIHDWRNRSDRLLPIEGEIRWLEEFALSAEALDAIVSRSKKLGLSVKEGPYNDWWIGPENRIVISANRK